MATFYKLIIFALIFGLAAIAGYYLFRYLNKKIKESNTGWALFGYSVLLFLGNAVLFFGGIYLLICTYTFLR